MGQAQPGQQQQNQQNPQTNPELASNYWARKQEEAEKIMDDNPQTQEQEQPIEQFQQPDVLQQIEQQEQQEYKEEQQQIEEEHEQKMSPEEIEHIWLSRTFKILTSTQTIIEKKTHIIPLNADLTVDLMVDEIIYSFLISPQFNEEEKFIWLINGQFQLAQTKINEGFVEVLEGPIEYAKFQKILDCVQSYIITGVLYPEGLEWTAQKENIQKPDDISNDKANHVFHSIFEKSFSLCSLNEVRHLLNYLETKASIDDAHLFLDFMFKRELSNNKLLSLKDNKQQLQSIQFLAEVACYPKITQSLLMNSWAYGKFSLIQYGRQFNEYSIVGRILSISGFFTGGQEWINYFQGEYRIQQAQRDSLRTRIYKVIDEFTLVVQSILKKGPNLRQEFFKYISKIIELNLNLEKLFNQQLQLQCSSPGMVFNLQQVLLKVFNPWIDDLDNRMAKLKKVDKSLLSYLKKHPFLAPLYQNIDQIAPETTPFLEPEEFSMNLDTMTMMYLLTQRINHLVATNLDQFYINQILKNMQMVMQQTGQHSDQFQKLLKMKLGYDASILHKGSMRNTMQFLAFSSKLALSLLDQDNKPVYPYGLLASSFLNDIHSFIATYNYNEECKNFDNEVQSCCEYAIMVMNNRNLLANPHLRVKGIELFHLFDSPNYERKKRQFSNNPIFRNNEIIKKNLMAGLLKAFIDSEKTGAGNQFYEKFAFRYQFCKLVRFLLEQHQDIYQETLQISVSQEKDQFLAFANFYLNDMIFLLDECLSKLKLMKEIEDEIDNQNLTRQTTHAEIEKQLKTYTLFLTEYYKNIQVFSEVQPEAFLTDEIRDKLANNLNYTLQQLNGSQASQYKTRSLKIVNFDPSLIMGNAIELYINFSKDEQFLQQVVKDERCFSIDLFQRTINILDKHTIIPYPRIVLFRELIEKLIILQEQEEFQKSIMADIPEEFVDPIVSTLMTDPVKLPHSNMIVDRLTIKKQLLNTPEDPFDRSHLTVEMLIEQPELKQKIKDYLEKKRQEIKNKQTIKQQQE